MESSKTETQDPALSSKSHLKVFLPSYACVLDAVYPRRMPFGVAQWLFENA